MKQSKKNLIWIDLEMTGLNTEVDSIIEIATIVTDSQLNVVAEGPVFAIHQSDEVLAGMDEWNTKQHNKSGLVPRVKASMVNEAEAEVQTLAFLKTHVSPNKSPMCGNSICQDRRFLHRHMPSLENYFHSNHYNPMSIGKKHLKLRELALYYSSFIKPSYKQSQK